MRNAVLKSRLLCFWSLLTEHWSLVWGLSIGRLSGEFWSQVTARHAVPKAMAGMHATADLPSASRIGTKLPVDIRMHLPDERYCVEFLSSKVLHALSWQAFPQMVKRARCTIYTQLGAEAQFPSTAVD